ncbi:hypothetical protein pb186bvf_014945 [Paramecium bursaria]
MDITISQISLKSPIGRCDIIIMVRFGEKKEIIKCSFVPPNKVVKYQNPQVMSFEGNGQKYIHFFIQQVEENGYINELGTQKFNVADIFGKDYVKVDICLNNTITIYTKWAQEQHEIKKSITKNTSQWQSSLRDVNSTSSYSQMAQQQKDIKPQASTRRYGSPIANQRRAPNQSKSPTQVRKSLGTSQITQHNKSSSSSIHQQRALEEYKEERLKNDVLDESEEFQHSPDQRNEVPQPYDYSKIDRLTQQVQQVQQQVTLQQQLSSTNNRYSSKQFGEDDSAYRQMAKDLSLLLNTQLDCQIIVGAVQQLLQRSRNEGEQLLKLQYDIKLLQTQLDNIHEQKKIIENKQEDFKSYIKKKLNQYKTLFEENVQLKNTLKEDLQKIVDLNIQIRELKSNQNEKKEIDQKLQELQIQIDDVCKDVELKQTQNIIFQEELQQALNFQF